MMCHNNISTFSNRHNVTDKGNRYSEVLPIHRIMHVDIIVVQLFFIDL